MLLKPLQVRESPGWTILSLNRAGWCVEGETILSICERGDKLLDEEVGKVYKGKKILKGALTE